MKFLLMLFAVCAATVAYAQQSKLYDARGNLVGTVDPISPNSKRLYDARGRSLGTSTTSSEGTTTIYDAQGRVIGRTTEKRK